MDIYIMCISIFLLLVVSISAVDVDLCPEPNKGKSGVTQSEGFPYEDTLRDGSVCYPNKYSCPIKFKTDKGHTLRLNFTHFKLIPTSKCSDDYLEIRDGYIPGSKLIGKYCGENECFGEDAPCPDITGLINGTGRYMRLNFKTNDINDFPCTGYGWEVHWDSIPICDTVSCGSHGDCTDHNICTCDQGYEGKECHIPICDGGCGDGTCTSPGKCSCEYGYEGTNCETAICDEVSCGIHGDCTDHNICTCDEGYEGKECHTPICKVSCGFHGKCSEPNICKCSPGYDGAVCDSPICASLEKLLLKGATGCGLHGTCTAPNTCNCEDGYAGTSCQTAVCDAGCGSHGKCSEPNICSCSPGYEGQVCQLPICVADCGSYGSCTAPDTCTCSQGYQGDVCDSPSCEGGCGSYGRCTAPDTCECSQGYQGDNCEAAICDNSCGFGICSQPNICSCSHGYRGTYCDKPMCDEGCEVHGRCLGPDNCDCNSGYTGAACQHRDNCFKANFHVGSLGIPLYKSEVKSEVKCQENCAAEQLCTFWHWYYTETRTAGDCLLMYTDSDFQGHLQKMSVTSGPAVCSAEGDCFNTDGGLYYGESLKSITAATEDKCQGACRNVSGCANFNYLPDTGICYLEPKNNPLGHIIAGSKQCNLTEPCFLEGIWYKSSSQSPSVHAASATDCQLECQKSDSCQKWSYSPVNNVQKKNCHLLEENAIPDDVEVGEDAISGPKFCENPGDDECSLESVCGDNTGCDEVNYKAVCICLSGYYGNPVTGCRDYCIADAECGTAEACIDSKCHQQGSTDYNCFRADSHFGFESPLYTAEVSSEVKCEQHCLDESLCSKWQWYYADNEQRGTCSLYHGEEDSFRMIRVTAGPRDCAEADCLYTDGHFYYGMSLNTFSLPSLEDCQEKCSSTEYCAQFNYWEDTDRCDLEPANNLLTQVVAGSRSCKSRCFTEDNFFNSTAPVDKKHTPSATECQEACQSEPECFYWNWTPVSNSVELNCYLMDQAAGQENTYTEFAIAGTKFCQM